MLPARSIVLANWFACEPGCTSAIARISLTSLHGGISLNSVLLLLVVDFEWVQVKIDVYIPHRKYQVKPQPSPWFLAACTAAIVYGNHFFRLYQENKSSDSKVKFKEAKNCCRRVLEAAKPAYANKTNKSITSKKPGFRNFWQIANSVLKKGKSAITLLFSSPEVLSSASDKTNLFAKAFSWWLRYPFPF